MNARPAAGPWGRGAGLAGRGKGKGARGDGEVAGLERRRKAGLAGQRAQGQRGKRARFPELQGSWTHRGQKGRGSTIAAEAGGLSTRRRPTHRGGIEALPAERVCGPERAGARAVAAPPVALHGAEAQPGFRRVGVAGTARARGSGTRLGTRLPKVVRGDSRGGWEEAPCGCGGQGDLLRPGLGVLGSGALARVRSATARSAGKDPGPSLRVPGSPQLSRTGSVGLGETRPAWGDRWKPTQPRQAEPQKRWDTGSRPPAAGWSREDPRAPDTHPPPSGCRAGTSWPAGCPWPPAPGRPGPGALGRRRAPAGGAAARGRAWSRREALAARRGAGRRVRSPRRAATAAPGPRRSSAAAAAARATAALRQAPTLYRSPGGGRGAGGSSAAARGALTSPYSEPGRRDIRPGASSVFLLRDERAPGQRPPPFPRSPVRPPHVGLSLPTLDAFAPSRLEPSPPRPHSLCSDPALGSRDPEA